MKRIRTRLAAVLAVCFLIFSVTAAADAAYDGYIVCFKDDDAAARAEQLLESLPVLYADDGEELAAALDPIYGGETLFTVESDALVELFEREGLLSYSEPDYYVTLYGYDYAAEPQFSSQWAHTATGIRAAWELGLYGNDVTVAVLDSGIYEHADLAENLLPGINYVKPNSVTPADPDDLTDTVGHGTKVAGVICAAANARGVVGAAHRAKVLPLKVAGSSDFKNSYVAGAINQAIELSVDVISMSFGYNSDTDMASRTVKQAVKNALANNIIVVAAAGNDGNDPTKGGMYAYPASYDGVISVANLAQTATGYAVSSSSRHNDKVTIAAPGASILTTAVGGGYASVSGTSFSAPIVSAAAALLLFIEFPIFPATPHLKLNVSDFPVLLASFIFGPISGIVVNAVKVGLCLLIRGTSTAFVGDISNLVSGTLYALSAGVIYMLKRNKTGAVLALVCGSLIFCLSMWVCNDLFLLPLFGITDKAAKLTMLWWTLLFNVIKTFLTSLITFYVYKKVRRLFDKF